MTFRRFEEVAAWQTARNLARAVYAASAKGGFARDFNLRDQVRSAVVSMMANIAEGLGRKSDKEFTHFLFTGKGSVHEVQSHLYVALDLGYLDEANFQQMFEQAELYARQVSGLISHLTGHLKRRK